MLLCSGRIMKHLVRPVKEAGLYPRLQPFCREQGQTQEVTLRCVHLGYRTSTRASLDGLQRSTTPWMGLREREGEGTVCLLLSHLLFSIIRGYPRCISYGPPERHHQQGTIHMDLSQELAYAIVGTATTGSIKLCSYLMLELGAHGSGSQEAG